MLSYRSKCKGDYTLQILRFSKGRPSKGRRSKGRPSKGRPSKGRLHTARYPCCSVACLHEFVSFCYRMHKHRPTVSARRTPTPNASHSYCSRVAPVVNCIIALRLAIPVCTCSKAGLNGRLLDQVAELPPLTSLRVCCFSYKKHS